ncbi:MAG: DJ-1/PfpI/YhbO family deglycase/protease, partial [Ornithinimicrobium sp.]
GPAAGAAGPWMLLSLAVVAVVAGANASSSAVLAARYPRAGGTYVYGTQQLGPLPGFLAGWCFVIGKSASCVAMALTLGSYVVPGQERVAAVVAVAAVTVANLRGMRRSAALSRVIVSIVLSVVFGLGVSAVVAQAGGAGLFDLSVGLPRPTGGSLYGVLQGAGLLFFAFAGYARIATLGEEVRDPERTIGQAIAITFAVVLAVYAAVALLLLGVLGVEGTAGSQAPLAQVADRLWAPHWVWLVRLAAACAALGALLNLMLGISRTVLAMARDHHLPAALARVGGPEQLPRTAEISVALVVGVVATTVDLRGAIGFSSFAVLLYYAVTNASAISLRGPRRWQRVVAVVGLLGCLLLVLTLPGSSVLAGLVLVALGSMWFAVARRGLRGPGPAGQVAGSANASHSGDMTDTTSHTSDSAQTIAFLVASEGIERVELTKPRDSAQDAGFTTHVLSPETGTVQTFDHLDKAEEIEVDRAVSEASVDDYAALVLPGGVPNPDALRLDEGAVEFVRSFVASGKPVAAICHAPWVLIEADVVRGRRVTSFPSVATDLRNAGAEWVDEQVVVDGNLITSRNPDDIPAFSSAVLEAAQHGPDAARQTG